MQASPCVRIHWRPDQAGERRDDWLATEEPLEIQLDGAPLAVIMRTPGHDIELATGFLHAESIISSSDDLATIAHCSDPDVEHADNIVKVKLLSAAKARAETKTALDHAARTGITSSSCGVCGKRSIESLAIHRPPDAAPPIVDARLVASLPEALRQAQSTFDQTGGLHAAALFDGDGNAIVLREDVGRHNAVDKCIGHLLLHERPVPPDAVLMVSGRTSFEIIQKACLAGIRTVAGVSAPSSLALSLAAHMNMGLCGFVRSGALNLYHGRLGDGSTPPG